MIALVLSLAFAAPEASALNDFLHGADQANVDRRLSREQVRRAALEFRQAWMALLPSLTASAGWTHNQYPAEFSPTAGIQQFVDLIPPGFIDPARLTALQNQPPTVIMPKNQLDAALRFELPIIDPGRWLRAAGASLVSDGTEVRDELTADNVRRAVINAYYGYLAALAVRDSAKKTQAVAEAQLKLVEARVSVGSGTELELLRSKAEAQRAKQTIADTEAVVATSARALETLSGRTPAAAIAMPESDLSAEPPVEELEKSIDKLPALRAASVDLRTSERALLASRLAILPTINFQFTERFTNATGFQNQSTLYNLGFNLVWRLDVPVFQGMVVQGAAVSLAELQAEKSRLAARDQVNADWQRLNAALTKVQAARAQAEAAQRAAQVARDRYAVGATTQLELIQTDRDMFAAEVGEIQAKTELALARASLRISTARPVD
ncbi:MAG: TolC family protein [Deltaproteobacteria bacterium]|nr:TolC family protein [Deltaproteobacteria bacterium]